MIASFDVVVGNEGFGLDVEVRPLCSPTFSADVAFGCVIVLVNHTAFVERQVTSIGDYWHFTLVIGADSEDKTEDCLHPLPAAAPLLLVIRWLDGGDAVLRAFWDDIPDVGNEFRAGPIPVRRWSNECAALLLAAAFKQPFATAETPRIVGHIKFAVKLSIPGAGATQSLRKGWHSAVDPLHELAFFVVTEFDD